MENCTDNWKKNSHIIYTNFYQFKWVSCVPARQRWSSQYPKRYLNLVSFVRGGIWGWGVLRGDLLNLSVATRNLSLFARREFVAFGLCGVERADAFVCFWCGGRIEEEEILSTRIVVDGRWEAQGDRRCNRCQTGNSANDSMGFLILITLIYSVPSSLLYQYDRILYQ